MRPDEHKKKKNEAYKKKHGIKNKKQQAGVLTDHLSKTTVRNEQQRTNESSSASKQQHHMRLETNSSEDEVVPRKPQFDRRKIESNWQRYEEPEQQYGEDKYIGADFQQLLANTASGLTQFRFKHESLLEQQTESDDLSTSSKFLSINCDQLSLALECIPLYEMLSLDENYFDKNQIHHQKTFGEKKLKEYNNLFNQVDDDYTPHSDCLEQETHIISSDSHIHISKQTVIPTEPAVDSCHVRNTETDRISTETAESNNARVYDNKNTEAEADELDQLLNVSDRCSENDDTLLKGTHVIETKKPAGESSSKGLIKTKTKQTVAKEVVSLEDQLDDLLQLDSDDTVHEKPHNDNGSVVAKKSSKSDDVKEDSQNLEDWLDSILD